MPHPRKLRVIFLQALTNASLSRGSSVYFAPDEASFGCGSFTSVPWLLAFLAAECGRRLAARPGRSSSLRSGAPLGPAASPAADWQLSGNGQLCPGTSRPRSWAASCGRRVVARPGSGLSEESAPGVQVGRAGDRAAPLLPSRALGTSCGPPGICLQAGEHGVADLPLQRAQGLFQCLALGQLLVVIGAALAVPVADLGDRRHVDGVVEPPFPAPG
jgi:hypothetical protein